MGQQPGAANSQAFARQTKVKKGSRVRLVVERGRMIVTPVTTGKITLKSLLAKVTPENIHPETDWGKPVGKEIWPQEPGLAGAPCRIHRQTRRGDFDRRAAACRQPPATPEGLNAFAHTLTCRK